MQLEKEIEKFKEQLLSLKEQNLDLGHVVKWITNKRLLQEADYTRMKKDENLV